MTNYLKEVRQQYEHLPYPPFDPKDELKELNKTWLEDLPKINHYCFAGKNTFQNNFRVLIAGGGTGDATIFLAHQLRNTNAEIVHLDLSSASIAIAKERARLRELTNITWIEDSLLNIPSLGLGKFDYIGCSGVLHHLADPDAGLTALKSVLKDGGAMGIAVYATYGRTAIYQMQDLLRRINSGSQGINERLDNAKEILKMLPPTNWFRRSPDLHTDHQKFGDAGIYDLLLHSQDRAYTVPELFAWVEDQHGMHMELTEVYSGLGAYLPYMQMQGQKPAVLERINGLPVKEQYAIAEIFTGRVVMHSFFVTMQKIGKAPYGDSNYVPFFFHENDISGPMMESIFNTNKNKGKTFLLEHPVAGVAFPVNPGKYGPRILREIDGKKTFGEIFEIVRSDIQYRFDGLNDEKLFADFKESFYALSNLDRLMLRHRDCPVVL